MVRLTVEMARLITDMDNDTNQMGRSPLVFAALLFACNAAR